MLKTPDLTIIIVNYNTKEYVLTCLSCIFKYKYSLIIEVWVVDNGSTDGSADNIKDAFPQVKLIENRQNYFYSYANNQALKKVKSKYFLILNSDVLLAQNTLSEMHKFMQNHSECGLANCRQVGINKKILCTSHRRHSPITQLFMLPIFYQFFKNTRLLKNFFYDGWNRRTTKQVDTIPGSFMFGRTEIFKKIGYFDASLELFYSDVDLCDRIRKEGFKIYHNGKTSVTHNVSQTLSQFPLVWIEHQSYRDMVKYYNNHFGFLWAGALYVFTRFSILFNAQYVIDYFKFTIKRIVIYYESYKDRRRLLARFPNLAQLESLIKKNCQLLKPAYLDYVTHISPDYMAISLELAAFLLSFCQIMKPKKVADLGTGFSSYVFNIYAKGAKKDVQIWSVDDNILWLNKSKDWLIHKRIVPSQLLTWNIFRTKSKPQFDLIFHDLGNMHTRLKTLPAVLKLVSSSGYVILDDLQFPIYTLPAKNIVKESGATLYSLRHFVLDKYRRYACLVYVV